MILRGVLYHKDTENVTINTLFDEYADFLGMN